MDLLRTMVFTGVGRYQLSLTERCGELLSRGVKISKQGLDKRLNEKASVFIKSILKEVLKLKLMEGSTLHFLNDFNSVKIIDATSFQLPGKLSDHYVGSGGGGSRSGVKTHYRIDITNGDQMDVEIMDGIGSDTGTGLIRGQSGDLLLFDLGYCSLNILSAMETDKAWYVSRIRFSTQIWLQTPDGIKALNWQDQINKMQVGQLEELQVYLGKDKKVKSRLIVEKVPNQLADQKRRKLKTDKINKRKKISKARLAFCAVNAFITNTTKEQLPATDLRSIYALRWQVEIYFKTWKSYMNIDKIEKMNIHRFNCTHYGTLIYIILSCKLFLFFKQSTWQKHRKELSELKAMKMLAKHRNLLWEIFYLPIQKARDRLQTLRDMFDTHCIKERKNGILTPYQTMEKVLS